MSGGRVTVERARVDDLVEYATLREQGYALPGTREDWVARVARDPKLRMLGARRDGRLVGMLNVLAFAQWFGGRAVPMGGVASVVVAPEERGRGIAPQLLDAAIGVMRDDGEAISTLGPATSWVYRKCGWEHGGRYAVVTVRTSDLTALPAGPERERRAGSDDRDAMIAVYDRVAPNRPGYLRRPDWLWADRLAPAPHRYEYVVERDGVVDGFVTYTQSRQARGYAVWVDDLVAGHADSERALWRHLGAHGAQADRITIAGVPVDALALLLPEQTIRPLGQQLWMTRIVDAPRAIARRGFPSGLRVDAAFRLADARVAANDGCWRLVVDGGEGRLERADAGPAPDGELSINGFASLYTGWATTGVLAAAGLARGLSGAVGASLDAAFSGREPVMCDDF